MNVPLDGLRVLDFTHLLPGQICAGILSDLGAEILHVDAPNKKSLAHHLPPIVEGESLYFWVLHKRKSSLVVDLKAEKGKDVVRRLAGDADIILENFRPGVMSRLKLGYEDVKVINERVIYCSISGYGQDSPQRHKAAHDLNLVAESGLLNLNRRKGERPVLPSIPISDYMSGMLAVISILSALYQRSQSLKGQYLDISMLDSALSSLNILTSMSIYTEKEPEEGGFAYPRELPTYNVYECKDGRYLAVASLEPDFYREFLSIIERLDILEKGLDDRTLTEELASTIARRTLQQWRDLFAGSNCCVSPVNTISEALAHYPLDARGMLHRLEHPTLGSVPQVTFPVSAALRDQKRKSFSVEESDRSFSRLLESGFSENEIRSMRDSGIISLYMAD